MLLALLVLVEGTSSLILLLRDAASFDGTPLAERKHTRYDPELGWEHIPNARVDDLYGPGLGVGINSQSLRAPRDYPLAVPPGKVRVVCLGDSFTFGYGVALEKSWVHRLGELDPRLETINMGMGGYGIDQAFLWYLRDGVRFDQDVLLFAFVGEDFQRALEDDFLGYGKPRLVPEGEGLRVINTPVPRIPYLLGWVTRSWPVLRRLRTVQLWSDIRRRGRSGEGTPGPGAGELEAITARIFAGLRQAAGEKGAVPVLVYLPSTPDLQGETDGLRAMLARLGAGGGYHYLDLAGPVLLRGASARRLFLPGNLHYTEEGNELVARLLLMALAEIPEVGGRMEAATPAP